MDVAVDNPDSREGSAESTGLGSPYANLTSGRRRYHDVLNHPLLWRVAATGLVILALPGSPHSTALVFLLFALSLVVRMPWLVASTGLVVSIGSWATREGDPTGLFADHAREILANAGRAANLIEFFFLSALLLVAWFAPLRTLQPPSADRRRVMGATVLLVVVLAASHASRERCLIPSIDGLHIGWSCYSELSALYEKRGFSTGHPVYLEGTGELRGENPTGDFEYPPGTGAVVAGALVISESKVGFLRGNTFILSALTVGGFLLMAGLLKDRRRLLLFVASPVVFFHAFTNWDLAAVFWMIAGLVAASRKREVLSGALLGIGAATKVFPGALLPVVALSYAFRKGRLPWGVVASSVGAFAVMNVPLAIINPDSYRAIWEFHLTRDPQIGSLFAMLGRRVSEGFLHDSSVRGLAIFLFGLSVILWLELSQARRSGVFRVWAAAGSALALWMTVSKILSPQALLWIVPFLVMVKVPGWVWMLFAQSSLLYTVASTGYELLDETEQASHWLAVLDVSTAVRTVMLLVVVIWCARSQESVNGHPQASGRIYWRNRPGRRFAAGAHS